MLPAWLLQQRTKRLLWALGLVLFYTVFGFLILPLIVRAVAVSQLSKMLDRPVKIEKVRINPYVLSASIQGLVIQDKDGERFVGLNEGYANFQLISFFHKAWTFKEVRVVEPYARVQVNKDSTLNFSDLLAKFSKPSGEPPKKPSKPLSLEIGQLRIAGAQVSLADLTTSTPFHRRIGPVQLTLTGLYTDPENRNPYSFSGTTDSGERFSWTGYFFLDPLRSHGAFSVENVSLAQYAPAYQDMVRFDIKDGVVDVRAEYEVKWQDGLRAAVVTNAAFRMHSLKLAGKGDPEPFASLDELAVTGASADAVARRVEVGSVAVAGGSLRVLRETNAEVNVVELAKPASTNVSGGMMLLLQTATNLVAQLTASTNAGAVRVGSVAVTNCAVAFQDRSGTRAVNLALSDITFGATNLSNLPGAAMGGAAALRWNTNGTAEARFGAELAPPLVDVNLKVDQLELAPLSPYLDSLVSLFVLGSKLSVDGRLQLASTNGEPNATFRGNARLDDFAGQDAATGKEILHWGSLGFNGIQAGLNPPAVTLAHLNVNDLTARVVLETNRMLNLMRVARLERPAAGSNAPAATVLSEPAPSPAGGGARKSFGLLARAFSSTNLSFLKTPVRMQAPLLTLSNATVLLEDQSISPPAALSMRSLSGQVTGLSSDLDQDIKFDLATKVDGTGPVAVSGVLPPAATHATNQIKVVVQNVNLVPTSTYAGRYLGYGLRKGKLNLDIDYEMTARTIRAKNVLKLDQFTLGEKVASPDATKLPVKLAVAILKDRNGLIELDVPIEGNLDDPQFHIGKAVLLVLGNIVTKLVTSPFAALGSVFGGKGEEVSYQPFKPGSAELLPENRGNLEALLKGLQERPGLQLAIEGSYDEKADGDVFRRARLQLRFRTEKWRRQGVTARERVTPETIDFTPAEYQQALKRAYEALVVQAMVASNAVASASAPGTSRPAQPATADQKGAEILAGGRTLVVPVTPQNEMELAVLETVPVSAEELGELAQKRASRVEKAVLDSGLIEKDRVSIADPATLETTNHAARVFFHLQ